MHLKRVCRALRMRKLRGLWTGLIKYWVSFTEYTYLCFFRSFLYEIVSLTNVLRFALLLWLSYTVAVVPNLITCDVKAHSIGLQSVQSLGESLGVKVIIVWDSSHHWPTFTCISSTSTSWKFLYILGMGLWGEAITARPDRSGAIQSWQLWDPCLELAHKHYILLFFNIRWISTLNLYICEDIWVFGSTILFSAPAF